MGSGPDEVRRAGEPTTWTEPPDAGPPADGDADRAPKPTVDHATLVAALRRAEIAPPRVIDAFERVDRRHFLPGLEPAAVYIDDAVVTHTEGEGVPTSSSSQPTLMAAMLARLDVRPGDRVLEIGAGTGFNAALLADLAGPEGSVTAGGTQPPGAGGGPPHPQAGRGRRRRG